MRIRTWAVATAIGLASGAAQAESIAETIGRHVGEFSSGVGTAAMAPVMDSQPQWITVAPRSKSECLAESSQVINERYVRCREGWQEYVRYGADGRKVVLSERAIPRW